MPEQHAVGTTACIAMQVSGVQAQAWAADLPTTLHILKYLMILQFLELKARLLLSLGPEKIPELRPQPYNPFPAKNIYLYAKALFP